MKTLLRSPSMEHRKIRRSGNEDGGNGRPPQQTHQTRAQGPPRAQADLANTEGTRESRRQRPDLHDLRTFRNQRYKCRIEPLMVIALIYAQHDRPPAGGGKVLCEMARTMNAGDSAWRKVRGDQNHRALSRCSVVKQLHEAVYLVPSTTRVCGASKSFSNSVRKHGSKISGRVLSRVGRQETMSRKPTAIITSRT